MRANPLPLAERLFRTLAGMSAVVGDKELWEELARLTVGAALHVPIEEWDENGRQNAPDGRFELDGRLGFVEATRHANTTAESGRVRYGDRRRWWADGVEGTYHVWIDPIVRLGEHDRYVPVLIRAMEDMPSAPLIEVVESLGRDEPSAHAWAIELVERRRLRIQHWHSNDPAGTVFTTASMGRGGVPGDDPNAILDGVASSMLWPSIRKRLKKLSRCYGAEKYLFVRVDDDVWEFAAWSQLIESGESQRVPTEVPNVPDDLNGVWVWSRLNKSALRWLSASGWSWQVVELPPGMLWQSPLTSSGI